MDRTVAARPFVIAGKYFPILSKRLARRARPMARAATARWLSRALGIYIYNCRAEVLRRACALEPFVSGGQRGFVVALYEWKRLVIAARLQKHSYIH